MKAVVGLAEDTDVGGDFGVDVDDRFRYHC
jgi:hypothetical protein